MPVNLPDFSPTTIVLLLACLSLLPFALIMLTSFVKISVVLSLLRVGVGTPQIPPAIVINGLALILTAYVMAPTGKNLFRAIEPTLAKAYRGEASFSLPNMLTLIDQGKEGCRRNNNKAQQNGRNKKKSNANSRKLVWM